MMMNSLKRTLKIKIDMIRFYTFTPAINTDFVDVNRILRENNYLTTELDIPIP